jgi:cysteine-rich repeat protein
LDDAIGDLESAIESDDGEAASSALGDLDDAEELIERAIIKKEFIENQKLDKLDFFLDQIIDDVGTQENDPVNEILLGDVKEEWFNIQVKLIWLNDLLKGLNEQIGFAEEDIEEIFFIFEECLDSEDVEECPDSELEFITILLNNVVNSIVRVILALVDVEEVENLIDDIREEKAAVELQIDTLCSADAIDNERICDKLQRKLTGMNKALDYIDEELEEIVDELGDSLDDLFSALFFILDEIGLFSEEPPEISSDNYVEVIDQLYQTLGQAVSNGIPAQSIKPAQLDEFLEMLADARDDIRDAKSIKETIELHKFPVLFERFRSFEETIGGSVKPDEVFGDTDFEAKEARHIQTKVLRMFSLLHLINVHAAEIEDELIEFFEESDEDFGDTEENFFAIVEKFDALVELKDGEGGLVDEIGDLESEIIGEIDSGDLSEVTGAHILRNIDKIQSLADLINIEFSIMGFLLEAFGNTCCDFDSFIFLTLFIAEKEAIEEKKLVELEEALVEIENALLGCDDDDHDELFENPFCFRNCGFDDLCGDGKVQFALGEQCDDGNNVDNDACTNDCRAPECGDGIVQAGEECDDGNVIDGDGCSFDCKIPDPDGDGICDEGDSVLPCQWNEGCDIALDCGFGGACDEGSCECPGLKCEDDDDCVGKIDCSSIGGSCNVPGNCEFCSFDNGDVGECVCGD